MGTLTLTSTAFENKGLIPQKYTCDDEDINPPFKISGVPDGVVSFVFIMDDPDAPIGVWDHWIVFNIDSKIREIKEGQGLTGIKGTQTDGALEYTGPCPHEGEHRYFFKLYALDTFLNLPEGSSKQDVEKAMQGHILDQSHLMGLYKKG